MAKFLKKHFLTQALNDNKNNPKGLWRTLKSLLPITKSKSTITQVKDGDTIYTEDHDIAKSFNEYFTSIGSTLANKIPQTPNLALQDLAPPQESFRFQEIQINFTRKELKNLQLHKATGIDGIGSRLLKEGADELAEPLTYLYNLSIKTSKVPEDWKQAKVTPIYKEGPSNLQENYRPISVIPTIMKIFERAVHDQLYQYLTRLKLLILNQHGFRKLHSTNTTLIEVCDHLLSNLQRGAATGVLFLDLKKAFDTVNHELMLSKLNHYGIKGQENKWFQSYLSDRSQAVKINSSTSPFLPITCGVPQGSILGPLLFLVYINDLPKVLTFSNVTMYADDTAIYYSAKDSKMIKQCMQHDLNKLDTWFPVKKPSNRLSLNVKKTKLMIFCSPISQCNYNDVTLNVGNQEIDRVNTFKYLGIWLDKHLNFNEHISKLSKKLSQKISMLRRTRPYISKNAAIMLYKALILPHINYCASVWGTTGITNMDKIQKLQNRALRMILLRSHHTSSNDVHNELCLYKIKDRQCF